MVFYVQCPNELNLEYSVAMATKIFHDQSLSPSNDRAHQGLTLCSVSDESIISLLCNERTYLVVVWY